MNFMKKRNISLLIFLVLTIILYGNSLSTIGALDPQQNNDNSNDFLLYNRQIQEETRDQDVIHIFQAGKEQIIFPKAPEVSYKISSSSGMMAYQSHNPIYIDDNTDFGPLGYNFTGDGTFSKPYLIKELEITNDSFDLIYIVNTNVYFRIEGNLLNGSGSSNDGIYWNNVTHGTIYNNSVHSCFRGSRIEESKNNSIIGNKFYDNSLDGFCIYSSVNNTISSNLVYQNDRNGIQVETSCERLTIFNNTAFENNNSGIHIDSSDNNTILHNYAYENNEVGIQLSASTSSSRNNTISGNTLYNNSLRGFSSNNCPNNTISDNVMYNNEYQGIGVFSSSHDNRIFSNTVSYHNGSGIFISESDNAVLFNNTAYYNSYNAFLDTNKISSGISLYLLSNALVFNNTSSDSYDIGIGIWDVQDCIISNNTVYGNIDDGIQVSQNSNNVTVSQNRVSNSKTGVSLINSSYNVIDNNDIYCNGNISVCTPLGISDTLFSIQQTGGGNGIFLDPANYNNITRNRIYENLDNGIRMEDSNHNIIDDNEIYSNGGDSSPVGISDISFSIQQTGGGNGIFLDPSDYNNITDNTIFNNSGDGIVILNSSNNYLFNNDIYGNGGNGSPVGISDILFSIQQTGGGNGVFLDPANENQIIQNCIHDNRYHGILLIDSDQSTITGNTFFYNGLHGVYIDSNSVNNNIEGNDFVWNNLKGISQAFDAGFENHFDSNYWDEWWSTDDPYGINGGDNFDFNPTASPQNDKTGTFHYITRPRIIYPNGGDELSGSITIEWAKALDSWDHDPVVYEIYYSSNNGETWIHLAAQFDYSLEWDTSTVNDGSKYLIKVVAICTVGLSIEDTSDSSFTIQNETPETTTTEIVTSTSEEEHKTSVTSAPGLLLLLFSIPFVILVKRGLRQKSR